jgi:formylglycine-generating enzyme required for sulfatase activity/serine/threonine protein kinase
VPAPVPDLPPELANHPKFRIVRELGRGGMGVIYLAQHLIMDRPVALKVISPAVLDNPNAVVRFLSEVRAAGKLDHPNIARAHDADQAGSQHYLVMEYVEGVSLAQLVEKEGPLSVTAACRYVSQAALGLQHAYDQGMVHRDIKPHNLMLTPQGQVKVLDFGLARMRSERQGGIALACPGDVGGQASGRLTQMDSFMGTPEYISLEQAEDARNADTRSDIYSLGCTLYALLTGRPPFVGATATEIVLAHIEQESTPLHEVRADVPVEVSAVVAKMLAKDPKQRFQTPVEVTRALAPFARAAGKPGAAGGVLEPPVRADGAGTRIGGNTRRVSGSGTQESRSSVAGAESAKRESPLGVQVRGLAPRAERDHRSSELAVLPWWKRPGVMAVGAGAVLALILAVVITLSVKTPDGILVIEASEPNPEVFIDGEKVTVTWGQGRKRAEIAVKPGKHHVEVKKDGFEVSGEEVAIKDGDRYLLKASLRQMPPGRPNAGGGPPPVVPPGPPVAGKGAPDGDIVAKVMKVSGIELVSISAGSFYMGSPNDDKDAQPNQKPQHKVTISKPFYLGKYKVTVGQFKRFVEANPTFKTEAEKAGYPWTWRRPGYADKRMDQTEEHPVVHMSWNDANAFCQWLAKETDSKVRLPYDAEWEYSCRAVTEATKPTTRYYFGDDKAKLADYAWYGLNSWDPKTACGNTHPCGKKQPNAFKLYDMHGLVWELCADGIRTYTNQAETDPKGPSGPDASHVCRGGAFDASPEGCCAAGRFEVTPSRPVHSHGFRVLVEKAPSNSRPDKQIPPGGGAEKANNPGPDDGARAEGIAKEFTNAIGMKLVGIPGTKETNPAKGTFMMGSPVNESRVHPQWAKGEDQHPVEVSPFHLGVYEVKQRQFREVMGYNPSYFSTNARGKDGVRYGEQQPGGGKGLIPPGESTEDYPVENVSWEEAREFCEKLTAQDTKKPAGWLYRLPTEAEWEYACRGGKPGYQMFACGNSIRSTQANFNGTCPFPWDLAKGDIHLKRTCKVGEYPPNGFGLYDMHGNVWEWCSDWWAVDYYGKSPRKDPTGPADDTGGKVIRGGGWDFNGWDCRSARRPEGGMSPTNRYDAAGFRVGLVPPDR